MISVLFDKFFKLTYLFTDFKIPSYGNYVSYSMKKISFHPDNHFSYKVTRIALYYPILLVNMNIEFGFTFQFKLYGYATIFITTY